MPRPRNKSCKRRTRSQAGHCRPQTHKRTSRRDLLELQSSHRDLLELQARSSR
jgi:hypothetical protein